jgi:hypothetical protein
MTPNILKLGLAAYREVPVPKPGEQSGAYAIRLREWNRGRHELETCAGNLAISAARAVESLDPATRELVARLSATNKATPETSANRRSRADYNSYQADYMARRRAAAAKAAK